MISSALVIAGMLAQGAPSLEPPAGAQAPVAPPGYFYWYDGSGQLHLTDQIEHVPASLRQQVLQQAEDGQTGPAGNYSVVPGGEGAQAPEIPLGTNAKKRDAEAAEKAQWQQRMNDEKARIAQAESRIKEVEAEMIRLRATTPPGFQPQLVELDEERKALQLTIVDAQRELNEVIPEEARKAGVPPGYLR